jgi:hypothetical protein
MLNITSLAGILIPEVDMVRAMKNLSPANFIFDRNSGSVSSEISLHRSLTISINSFLRTI